VSNHEEAETTEPTGTLGRIRNMKVVAWVVIIGLVALTIGAVSFLFAIGL
jgi:hypothetical protein